MSPESTDTKPKDIQIDAHSFVFVQYQRDKKSAIYKSDDTYLRIGNPEKILADLAFHKKMEAQGFPVAKVISEGELDGQAYFVESSLGERHFGEIFAEDVGKTGSISQENFNQFLMIVEQFARAQLKTRSETKDFSKFANGIHLDVLCDELPEYAPKILAAFEIIKKKTAPLPFVITHGDFNPHNICPDGVIDFEDSFHAPFGHDLAGALSSADYFPDSTDFEFFARYRFSDDQKRQYFEVLDRICAEENLPPLSEFQNEFEFGRAVWLLVRMQAWPKLQKFRYDLFIERFLKNLQNV